MSSRMLKPPRAIKQLEVAWGPPPELQRSASVFSFALTIVLTEASLVGYWRAGSSCSPMAKWSTAAANPQRLHRPHSSRLSDMADAALVLRWCSPGCSPCWTSISQKRDYWPRERGYPPAPVAVGWRCPVVGPLLQRPRRSDHCQRRRLNRCPPPLDSRGSIGYRCGGQSSCDSFTAPYVAPLPVCCPP